jgi:hypothetical protein
MRDHCVHHRKYTPFCDGCREARRAWYWATRERRLETRRVYYRKNADHFRMQALEWQTSLQGRAWKKEYQRWYALKRNYGLSREDYLRLMDGQHGACAICSRRFSRVPIQVDHDHDSGDVRALLCPRCNTLLGLAGDNAALFEKAIRYLTRFRPEVKPDEPPNGDLAQP